jgi:predicted PurR-regulated permease PerM
MLYLINKFGGVCMIDKLQGLKKNTEAIFSGRYNRFIIGFVLTLLALWFLFNPLNFLINPLLSFFELILFPTVLSAILYYIFDPLIDWLEVHKVSRTVSISLLFTVLSLLFVLIGFLIVPTISDQVTTFIRHLPKELKELNKQLQDWLKEPFLRPFRDEINAQFDQANVYISKYGAQISSKTFHGIGSFVGYTFKILAELIIVPFMLFFLLKDKKRILPAVTNLLPVKFRSATEKVSKEIHDKFSIYFRAQLIMGTAVTALLMVSLKIAGLKYGLTLAIITGILNFLIPSFGAGIGAIPAIIVAFLMDSPWRVLAVFIIYYVIQHTESHLVAPLLLGTKLSVHPLTILILLIWAWENYKFAGVVVIIPLYMIIKVIITFAFEWYKEVSDHY